MQAVADPNKETTEPNSSQIKGAPDQQVVVLRLTNEQYGVDIARVQEIVRVQPITQVPHAPEFVEGVLNLRGRVIPVIDLRARFGFTPTEETRDTRIAIIDIAGTTVGLIVDGVSEVLTISGADIEPPNPVAVGRDAGFLSGVAKLQDRLILLVDVNELLGRAEQASLNDTHSLFGAQNALAE